MTFGAAPPIEEHLLSGQFGSCRLLWVELSEQIELRCGREVEDRHELGHEVDLAAPLQDIHALLRGDHVIAVKVSRPLLKLGEILDALQRPLGAEQPLDVHAAQRRRIKAVPEFLGANVADQMRGPIAGPIHVAIETGDSRARLQRPPIIGGIELLLRETASAAAAILPTASDLRGR